MLNYSNYFNQFYSFKNFFLNNFSHNITICVGDIISVELKQLNNKANVIDGLVISCSGNKSKQEVTLRKKSGIVGTTHRIFLNSPHIIKITKKETVKIRRSRLWFTRLLSNKKLRAKLAKKIKR